MSAPADLPFDLDSLPPAVREAFAAMQAKVAGLEAQTQRQDYLIAELRHALYGKRSEQLPPDERQLAFEDLETAVAEAEADCHRQRPSRIAHRRPHALGLPKAVKLKAQRGTRTAYDRSGAQGQKAARDRFNKTGSKRPKKRFVRPVDQINLR